MEITTVVGCRVYYDFCPQDLLMKKYGEENNTKKFLLSFFCVNYILK